MAEDKNIKIPKCIGIIMDGNRRWATENSLETLKGHHKGFETFKNLMKWAKEKKIKTVIAYGFSTENWGRSDKEVSYLMDLFETKLKEEKENFKKEGVRVTIIGEKERLSESIQSLIREIENETKDLSNIHLVLSISYGGRSEIIHAFNNFLMDNRGATSIEEKNLEEYLWTKDIPDPDIIIRTGGERRLSNFLPWQSVYSELFFTDTYWPDFSKEEFEKILLEFSNIERRNGK